MNYNNFKVLDQAAQPVRSGKRSGDRACACAASASNPPAGEADPPFLKLADSRRSFKKKFESPVYSMTLKSWQLFFECAILNVRLSADIFTYSYEIPISILRSQPSHSNPQRLQVLFQQPKHRDLKATTKRPQAYTQTLFHHPYEP